MVSALLRGLGASFTFLGTLLFTFWAGAALLTLAGAPQTVALIASVALAIPLSQAAARFVWRNAGMPGFLRSAALGAVVTGGVGFVLGFFGPLVLNPGSNQGPLLGIFITGPLGVVLGGIGGVAYWVWRRPRTVEQSPA